MGLPRTLEIIINGTENIAGTVDLIDPEKQMIGRITNLFHCSYRSFSKSLRLFLKNSVSPVEITQIDSHRKGNRRYFKVKLLNQ